VPAPRVSCLLCHQPPTTSPPRTHLLHRLSRTARSPILSIHVFSIAVILVIVIFFLDFTVVRDVI
jgi:hypothetical protein